MYFWHHSTQALWSNTRVLVRTTYSSWAVSRNHIHTNGFGKRLHYNIDNDPFLGAFWQENGIIKTARQKLQLSLKKMTQNLPWIFVDLLEIDRLQVDYVQWKTVATGRWIWVYWASTITWQKAQCANHVHTFGWTLLLKLLVVLIPMDDPFMFVRKRRQVGKALFLILIYACWLFESVSSVIWFGGINGFLLSLYSAVPL